MEPGGVLTVTRRDRLARSTRHPLNVLDTIKDQGVGFKSLADDWDNTTTPHLKLILTVLGGLAEFERTLISAHTSEGRTRAKARGVYLGRPSKLSDHQRHQANARKAAGERLTDIARDMNVHHSAIPRLKPELRA